MPSSPQAVVTSIVFDYEIGPDGKPLVDARVGVTLQANQATNNSPVVNLDTRTLYVLTDVNGYWQVSLVPNVNISPANTVYSVQTPVRSFDIQLTAAVGPYQASTLAVTTPASLPVATTTLPNPLTVNGLLTAAAGLSVTGAVTFPAASIALADIAPLPATDSLALHKAGAEAVTGVKDFTAAPPTFAAASIPIADVTPLPATDSLAVHKAGAEAITGAKTFSSNPIFNAGAIPDAALALRYLQVGAAASNSVATSQGRASAVYGDLATVGPTVTVTTGTQALVLLAAQNSNNTNGGSAFMGFAVSGATVIAASDLYAIGELGQFGAAWVFNANGIFLVTLNAGSNIFTAKYRSGGADTASFTNRVLTVVPFI